MRKNNNELIIPYQNKDLAMKYLVKKYGGEPLKFLTPNLLDIKEVLSTEAPIIKGEVLRMDNLFKLQDDSYLIVDYESAYKESNLGKYAGYFYDVCEKYSKDGDFPSIRLLIIYTTNDIPDKSLKYSKNINKAMEVTEVYLTDIKTNELILELDNKIKRNVNLTSQDFIKLTILPMTYESLEEKKKSIDNVISLINSINNEEERGLALSMFSVFNNNLFSDKKREYIKELIKMNGVYELIKKEFDQEKKEYVQQQLKQASIDSAKEMLKDGLKPTQIVKYVDLTIKEIKQLKEELNN